MAVTVQTVVIFSIGMEIIIFNFAISPIGVEIMILDFVRLEIMILDFVGGSKSGVPDGDQDKVVGAHFEDLGAKPFESLAARNPKMEMFNFPCSVGVNNLECKKWEEEQDVLPGSHVSDDIANSPTKRRRGVLGWAHVTST